jgi:DNA (cytosine-5)-methyltransferase 1
MSESSGCNVQALVRCLDLFCCEGGACEGYQRAGMRVVGVDVKKQPKYPGEFVQADALDYALQHGAEFDFIHASPPCQGYSPHVSSTDSPWCPTKGKNEPRLIEATRKVLRQIGKPWVMENVMGAQTTLQASLLLCGTMFGLPIARHRLFESSELIPMPPHPKCRNSAKAFAKKMGWDYRDMSCTGKGRRKGTAERWAQIMGVKHPMTQHGLAEAIPPAYTEFIGREIARGIRTHNAVGEGRGTPRTSPPPCSDRSAE